MAKTKGKEKTDKRWDAKPSHKIRHTILTVVITLLIVGSGAYAYIFFTSDTEASIQNSPTKLTTRTIASPAETNLRFDEEAFAFSLPKEWKKIGQQSTGPYRKYSYQSGLKNAENRYLDVYIDALPLNMAVNKAVAVRSEGSTLSHGTVSDNCTEFTTKGSALIAPAKWDGVDFLCDMDATGRNVIGTSAAGSINKVELTNAGFTKHMFFFVYTDHNFNPDYGIFYDFLDSFSVK